jgi:hypothetical protein
MPDIIIVPAGSFCWKAAREKSPKDEKKKQE